MPETVEGPLPALDEQCSSGVCASVAAAKVEAPARRRIVIGSMLLLACVVVALTVPGIRIRLQIVYLDLTGQIPDLALSDLPGLLAPGSRQPAISRLVATHNPYPVIHLPSNTAADIEAGAALFREQCATCHAPDGSGSP